MSPLERVKMCLAEAGFVEGRDYGGLCADDDDETYIHMWGYHYIHDFETVNLALQRATALVRQSAGDPKERKAV